MYAIDKWETEIKNQKMALPSTSRQLAFYSGDWLFIQATGFLSREFLKLNLGAWIMIQAPGSWAKNSLPDSVAWTPYIGAWIYVEKLCKADSVS